MKRILAILIIITLSISSAFSQIQSEEILLKNKEVELPGTLSYTKEKSPLVIWVHGSGSVNRDGNQPGRNVGASYAKQLRDSLNKKGIAFFSYDKRSANKNNIESLKKGILFNNLVEDVKTVVNNFKEDKRFSEIVLIGHSQGSLTAMLALENVNKYISLAGPSGTIDKTLVRQIGEKNPITGEMLRKHFKELKETGTIKKVNPSLMGLFSKINTPFLKSWVAINPSEEIKKVTIPTLIINGTKDLQVLVSDAEELHKANPKTTLKIIEGMNHVLKDVEDKNNLASYFSPDYPLSEEFLKIVIDFVKN